MALVRPNDPVRDIVRAPSAGDDLTEVWAADVTDDEPLYVDLKFTSRRLACGAGADRREVRIATRTKASGRRRPTGTRIEP